jgi:hypothetical protein
MPGPLSNAQAVTKLSAQDLERVRAFYRDKLAPGARDAAIPSVESARPLAAASHSRWSRAAARGWRSLTIPSASADVESSVDRRLLSPRRLRG